MTTFREWLTTQRARDDAIGDLADHVARDTSLTADGVDEIRQHLLDRNVEGDTIDALDDARAEFERSDDPPQPPPEPLSTH
jgi:tRNA A37 threonylcarbamoyltransferase TsaD